FGWKDYHPSHPVPPVHPVTLFLRPSVKRGRADGYFATSRRSACGKVPGVLGPRKPLRRLHMTGFRARIMYISPNLLILGLRGPRATVTATLSFPPSTSGVSCSRD